MFPVTINIGIAPPEDELSGSAASDRIAVRAVITRGDGKICLIRTSRGDLKFPGGGVEYGESFTGALVREVREEAGLVLDLSKPPKPLVKVLQRAPDICDSEKVFTMESLYYLCEAVTGSIDLQKQQLDDYEAEQDFRPEYILPRNALTENELLLLGGDRNGCDKPLNIWIYRDTVVLRALIEGNII